MMNREKCIWQADKLFFVHAVIEDYNIFIFITMNTDAEIEQIDEKSYKLIKLINATLENAIDLNIMFQMNPYHICLPMMHTLYDVSSLAGRLFSLFPNIFYQDNYTNRDEFRKDCGEKCLELLHLYDYMNKLRDIAFNEINEHNSVDKREYLIKAYNALDYPLIYNPQPLESRLFGTGKFTKPAP